MNDNSMYAIKRLHSTRATRHWQVDFTRRRQRYSHCFHDSVYGSSDAALRAAVAWRDGMLAHIGALCVKELYQAKHSRNDSGVEGVQFRRSSRLPAGIWQAELKLASGSWLRKSFSVSAHGRGKAFELAVAARKEMQRAVESNLVARALPAPQLAGQSSAPSGPIQAKTLFRARSGTSLQRNSTDGVTGVLFVTPKGQPAGAWRATLRLVDGRLWSKQFSVRMHGHDKAFELAAGARQVMLLRQAELQLYSCGSGSAP